ncbi:uncharacterized protein LOC8270512 [Ricinus communis]|uniref:Uncharacterized protein n=1 Tax=Ricinus communis TaxID=3988 RepID=B9S3K2_RICCO|nr:uncharacterized protein LOC8270512 [Ricinus communis]EEF41804.1 conserved hypothetical protein [Ricinus communis]|eukprot:XP_002520571.1 uncharacterized protein LOC8270512 [Ricinus communis]
MKRKAEVAEQEEEGQEAKKRFILSNCKVVEYLGPLMSKYLLFKFPDNSAFDFDYSQSSIWSPLVPRLHSPMELDSDLITPRKLSFGFGLHLGNNSNTSCSSRKIKMIKQKKKKKKKILGSEFSPAPIKATCVPFATKGWNKVLKAASKHFKKKNKKDSTGHVKLSNFLTDFQH